ncbi:MAG: DUF3990 domain-containing protein [Candidatus Azobacteroides sp.]|nr:DUF3990 domain-containing protein [Candidatus Azobacteroides sp.]
MRVYHGSDIRIDTVDLSKSKPGKDFGRGFYVTKLREQAEEMAKRIANWNHSHPVVTEFEFDEYSFEDEQFKTIRFDDYTEEWIDFILFNRKNRAKKQMHDYDIVEGPVADDDVTQRIYVYLREQISKRDFLDELKFHKPTHQICLCTIEALQTIEPVINDLFTTNIDDAVVQNLITEYGFSEEKAIDFYFNSKTFQQLIDENTGLCKKSWGEIYQILLKELK